MIKKVILISFSFLVLFFIRILYMQNVYLSECEKLQGVEKVKACEKVILFHFPLSPYTKKAINSIKFECDNMTKEKEKLYCYETLRSSLIQIRSFYQPYKEVIEKIKPKIAHLRAVETINWQFNKYSEQDYEKLYKDNLMVLQYDNAPSVLWSSVVVFSLLGWISSVIFIVFNLRDPIKISSLIFGVLGFILFFSLWIIGLWLS
ncbi:MAG: hypothetical protein RMI01_08495 [Thermodesulfovibrio sp.]|nr:hypothetical protein [Thermodesulfovibrio sp.]